MKVDHIGTDPLVSILIPTYNRPEYFQLALNSALAQTYSNIEIIIGDDSTDKRTQELIEETYLPLYKNLTYIRNQPTLGQFENDLMLFNQAKGEYVNFLMDDDLFYPEKIQKMMNYFISDANEEITLVTSYRKLIDEAGHELADTGINVKMYETDTVVNGIELGNRILVNCHNYIGEPTTTLFRKKALPVPFGTLDGRNYNCSVDLATWINLLSKGNAVYLAEPLSCFRLHSGQQYHTKLIDGTEDLTHLVLTSKKYGFLQQKHDLHQALLKVFNWDKAVLEHYLHAGESEMVQSRGRLAECVQAVQKELYFTEKQ